MLELTKSQIDALPFEFGGAVDKFIHDLEEHRKTTGEAAPIAPHPLVEAAVARVQYPVKAGKPDDFVRNFTILDDTLSLDDRKVMLANSLTQKANAAAKVVMPPLKQRLWEFEYLDASAIDPKKRNAGQKAVIAAHDVRIAKVQAIHRHLAKLHSEIHDLTDATIDGYKAAPFPT